MSRGSPPPRQSSRAPLRDAAPLLIVALVLAGAAYFAYSRGTWRLEHEEVSEYSHIRVRRKGPLRALRFVRDSGREVTETQIDLRAPHRLELPYARSMFASYLVVPDPQRVLIVGLGGGAMVHFLRHHDPEIEIDAVEIDPAVVAIADRFFDVRSDALTHIHTEDAFDFLNRTTDPYDVIYMDAFLKPSAGTDASGAPARLRSLRFYESLRERVTPDGAIAFNLTTHDGTEDDIDVIREAFPGSVVYRCPPARNLVVIAPIATDADGASAAEPEIRKRADTLDGRFGAAFSFHDLLDARRLGSPVRDRDPGGG